MSSEENTASAEIVATATTTPQPARELPAAGGVGSSDKTVATADLAPDIPRPSKRTLVLAPDIRVECWVEMRRAAELPFIRTCQGCPDLNTQFLTRMPIIMRKQSGEDVALNAHVFQKLPAINPASPIAILAFRAEQVPLSERVTTFLVEMLFSSDAKDASALQRQLRDAILCNEKDLADLQNAFQSDPDLMPIKISIRHERDVRKADSKLRRKREVASKFQIAPQRPHSPALGAQDVAMRRAEEITTVPAPK